jgi:hypothetical protein
MKNRLLGCLSVAVLGAALALPTPVVAFRGGGGGMHFGGGGFAGGGFRGGIVMGRSAFVPGAGRFAATPFAFQRFAVNQFNSFAFRNRFFRHDNQFRNFLVVGALGWPYYYGYGYTGCWQQVWTGDGWQWANVCYDYGY